MNQMQILRRRSSLSICILRDCALSNTLHASQITCYLKQKEQKALKVTISTVASLKCVIIYRFRSPANIYQTQRTHNLAACQVMKTKLRVDPF